VNERQFLSIVDKLSLQVHCITCSCSFNSSTGGLAMELTNIEQAVREGCTVYGIRSKQGRCVVIIKDTDKQLKGFGEHKHAITALQKADFDYTAEGRQYSETCNELQAEQLVQSVTKADDLDIWIQHGCTFDIVSEKHNFLFVLSGSNQNGKRFSHTGRGPTLFEAQLAAFTAPPCWAKKSPLR